MHAKQRATAQAPLDLPRGDPRGQELPPGHDPVLPTGDPRERAIDVVARGTHTVP
jgi:hypothetical protein